MKHSPEDQDSSVYAGHHSLGPRATQAAAGNHKHADLASRITVLEGSVGGGYPLDPAVLNATYGDHFKGASLDPKWTRVGYIASDETYQAGGGTYLLVNAPRTQANYYYQACPAGDFTMVMKAFCGHIASVMWGLMLMDNTGAGVGVAPYNAPDGAGLFPLTAGAYSGSGSSNDATPTNAVTSTGELAWYKLQKVGNVYTGSMSVNGLVWRSTNPTLTLGFVPTRMGFGGFLATSRQFGVDFFDVQ